MFDSLTNLDRALQGGVAVVGEPGDFIINGRGYVLRRVSGPDRLYWWFGPRMNLILPIDWGNRSN